MSKKRPNSGLDSLQSHWRESAAAIWFASSVKLYRNFEQYFFPGKLTLDQRGQVFELIEQGFRAAPHVGKLSFLHGNELSASDKEYIFEHFLMTESIHQAQKGDGFVIDPDGKFCAIINLRNHLQLQLVDFSGDLEEAYNRLVMIDAHLGSQANYAYNERFGFLTADPQRTGTGLVVTAYLHIPALIQSGQLEDILVELADSGLLSAGLQGDPEDFIGDVLLLSNAHTLGVKEESILATVRRGLMRVSMAEESLRTELRQNQNGAELKDAVSRALGTASHSYQLATVEALATMSLLKLGVELNWIDGLSVEEVSETFFHCRRAHLLRHSEPGVEKNEEAKLRAHFVKDAVHKAHFVANGGQA